MEFRTRFTIRPRYQHQTEGPSLTKQSFKDECDVNKIMEKYSRTGVFTHIRDSVPRFGDFSSVRDYQSALNLVLAAQDAFQTLPVALRKRFHHDPAEFLAFCQDPRNTDEAIRLGLATAREVQPLPSGTSKKDVPPVTPLDVTGGTDTKLN